MIVLPGGQIDVMQQVMDDILKRKSNTVAQIKEKFGLSKEEYCMIFDLTMPLIRKNNEGNIYSQRYRDMKREVTDILRGDKSETAEKIRECIQRIEERPRL